MCSVEQPMQLMDKAVHLVFQNKINAKNAFDVDTDFIQSLSRVIEQVNANPSEKATAAAGGIKGGEGLWLKASAGLDASAKIYGFRVDMVHQETYKVLGGLHR